MNKTEEKRQCSKRVCDLCEEIKILVNIPNHNDYFLFSEPLDLHSASNSCTIIGLKNSNSFLMGMYPEGMKAVGIHLPNAEEWRLKKIKTYIVGILKCSDIIQNKGTRLEKRVGVEIDCDYYDLLITDILGVNKKDLADDWVVAIREGSNFEKYNRYMYSFKLGKLRQQSTMEFYGKGVVD